MISSLSKSNTWLLFIHLTLGQSILYPFFFRSLISFSHLDTIINAQMINIFLETIIIIMSLWIAKDLIIESAKHFKEHALSNIKLVFKLFPLLYLASFVFNLLAQYFSPSDIAANQSLLNELFVSSPLYIAFAAIIYAPIMEELLFRAYFYGLFEKKSIPLAIIISGLVFGLAHMGVSSFSLADLAFLPSYAALGMIIAYSYAKTRTLFTPMLLHFLNNFVGILIMALL